MSEEPKKPSVLLRVIKYAAMGFVIYLGYVIYTA
jgi:hypothetical protein